jgi:hypothetical protein
MKKQKALTLSFYSFLMHAACASIINHLRCGGSKPEMKRHLNGMINSVLCRITIFDIMTEPEKSGTIYTVDEIRCIPIVDEEETDDSFRIDLPENLVEANREKIYRGQLMVTISNASYVNHELITGNDSLYNVVEESHRYRYLLERHLQVTGEVTVAVVRVSTPSESPVPSKAQLSSDYFGDHGFQKQYGDCSGGKLKIKNNGVYDVKISQTKASLGNDHTKIVEAAQDQLRKDLGIAQVADLAKKIVMCLPGGSYAGSWSASAGVNSYLMQVRSEYCLSLSVTMHEIGKSGNWVFFVLICISYHMSIYVRIGHLFGLLHAGEVSRKDLLQLYICPSI